MLGDRRGWGQADLVDVESGGGSFHLRAGDGAVGFPYLLFFIFFLAPCGAGGCDLYKGLVFGC